MKSIINSVLSSIARICSWKHLVWHLIAIALTYAIVTSGVDWWVVSAVRYSGLREFARLGNAGFVGFFMPLALPLICLAIGWMRRTWSLVKTGWLIAQAEILGLLLSFTYKALTGRPGPVHFSGTPDMVTDTSHVFHFGFLKGGVFWGWPSSHITVTIAAVVLLMILYRHNALVKYLALAYGIYMFIGVSLTFHWLSDGVAAVIFGSIVGSAVANRKTG
jgi:hypothetical protein